jgi:hypothetical protein
VLERFIGGSSKPAAPDAAAAPAETTAKPD